MQAVDGHGATVELFARTFEQELVALAGDDESVEEATVKRIFRENGRVRLQPENAAMEPIYADHVQLIGKVVGMFRKV